MGGTADTAWRRRRGRGLAAMLVVVAGLVVGSVPAPPAAATPSPPEDCPSGSSACVDRLISAMRSQVRDLASRCDHDVMFALLYRRVTEEYRRHIGQAGDLFDDPTWVNRLDVVFARRYFEAFDDWHRWGEAAPAWSVAFDRADREAVRGIGDVALGVNAHINHDLPGALVEVGLTGPEGRSHKADFDRVNEVLRAAYRPAVAELAARFDPTVDDADVPGVALDEEALLRLIFTWREQAWQTATTLALEDALGLRAVGDLGVASAAATEALTIATSTAYVEPGAADARRAWCEANQAG